MSTPLTLPIIAQLLDRESTAGGGGIHLDFLSEPFLFCSSHILHLYKDVSFPLWIQQSGNCWNSLQVVIMNAQYQK